MAIIGIYSDVHISRNSSILPLYTSDNESYTTRLEMCKQSLKWAYDQFEKNEVDVVINCGDTFNSHTITSDELSLYNTIITELYKPYDATSWSPLCDFTIIGNHDKFNDEFNSVNMLNLTRFSRLVKDYAYYDDAENDTDIYTVSYYEPEDFMLKILEMLENNPRLHSKSILFMHGDINGSCLVGNKRIENRIGTDFLTKHFDIIINGHIHCHELIYKQNNKKIYNIGSLTSHSFADSNKHIPSCWIFNTETEEIEGIVNPHAILFRTYEIINEFDVVQMINDLKLYENRFILKIKCPEYMKTEIEESLKNYNILKYKFIFIYENNIENNIESKSINNDTTISMTDNFISFLNDRDDLKGNINEYVDILR